MGQNKQEQLLGGTLTHLSKISGGTVITGDITSDGDFRIDGTMNGNITTDGRIVVGVGATVTGDIRCTAAEVEGTVIGALYVGDILSLKGTAVVKGEITTARLSVEVGAVLDVTSCRMNTENK